MVYLKRKIERDLQHALSRDKSILLLGPRQTGKTTLINNVFQPDISYTFVRASTRQRYEQNPVLFEKELETYLADHQKQPLIFIDEVQKIPKIMDTVQYFIDENKAQFILSGSSARKLKYGHDLNLLPGRVVSLTMPPLLYEELPDNKPPLEDLLLYGMLPNIILQPDAKAREIDLYTYVTTYLEEEVRAEALVRNVGHFSRFLEIAAGESGKQLNFSKISKNLGVADTTIKNYYQILDDCMIVNRIDPITQSVTKRRLVNSPRYLFFDMGIRRACANEGIQLPHKNMTDLFEQHIGNTLLCYARLTSPQIKLRYWRDTAGPEIDFVLEITKQYIPVEVKWSDQPNEHDARHLSRFLQEYDNAETAYIICRTPRRYRITDQVIALPWQAVSELFEKIG